MVSEGGTNAWLEVLSLTMEGHYSAASALSDITKDCVF